MIVDLGNGGPEHIDADVAVIGAGAAGLTLARALVEGGRSVLLLESGGMDYEAATADLNRGQAVGQPYYPLHDARLRFFGGTSAIWGGRSAELDAIDFEERPWVPWSGWPMRYGELRPYYERARLLLELPPRDPRAAPSVLDALDDDELCRRHWLIDNHFDRFGPRRSTDLLDHPRFTLALHATVREVLVSGNGTEVTGLDIRTPDSRCVRVTARDYVLAAGGLENPRILLASNSVIPQGIGNGHDLVGRFFMEHPHARGGSIAGGSAWKLLRAFQKRSLGRQETAAVLAPSPRLQRERQILNSALTVAVRPPAAGRQPLLTSAYLAAKHKFEPTRRGRAFWKTYKSAGRLARRLTGPAYWWARHAVGQGELVVVLRGEQAPNYDSRVTLTDERDALGMPRIRLDWRLLEQDRTSAAELVDAFARESARLGLGRVDPASWLKTGSDHWVSDPLVSVHPLGGYHHMGTTRMADDPRRGVADGWGRVHGVGNLYIAGSSLFPTGGWANPTLTILALALRTADHLVEKVR